VHTAAESIGVEVVEGGVIGMEWVLGHDTIGASASIEDLVTIGFLGVSFLLFHHVEFIV
jgi:hypothetical protein